MLYFFLAAAAATTSPPEPIHHDDPQVYEIPTPQTTWNPQHRAWVMAHYETRHEKPRPKETCMQVSEGIVNDDYMKCRNGYDWKAWVPGHYRD
jgi:hypothetical protein